MLEPICELRLFDISAIKSPLLGSEGAFFCTLKYEHWAGWSVSDAFPIWIRSDQACVLWCLHKSMCGHSTHILTCTRNTPWMEAGRCLEPSCWTARSTAWTLTALFKYPSSRPRQGQFLLIQLTPRHLHLPLSLGTFTRVPADLATSEVLGSYPCFSLFRTYSPGYFFYFFLGRCCFKNESI